MNQQPKTQHSTLLTTQPPTTLVTIEQFSERHPAFTPGAIRALRFNAKNNANGFGAAFKSVGTRRVYVDERAFFACIEALALQQLGGRRRNRAAKAA